MCMYPDLEVIGATNSLLSQFNKTIWNKGLYFVMSDAPWSKNDAVTSIPYIGHLFEHING